MKKKTTGYIVAALLALILAACGSNQAADQKKEEAQPAAESKEKDNGSSVKEADTLLGLTAKEYKTNFNKAAEEEGIDERMNSLEWKSSGSEGDHQIVDVQFDDDNRRMQLLAKEKEEDIRAVMLGDFTERDKALRLVRVMVKTVLPEATDGQVDDVIKELHLDGPEASEDYHKTELNGINFLVEDDTGFLSFVMANENDPDITEENFKNGDL